MVILCILDKVQSRQSENGKRASASGRKAVSGQLTGAVSICLTFSTLLSGCILEMKSLYLFSIPRLTEESKMLKEKKEDQKRLLNAHWALESEFKKCKDVSICF